MATSYYPQLSSLLDFSQLPAPFNDLTDGPDVLDTTFYQNLVVEPAAAGSGFTASIELVLFRELRFGVAGFALIVNPNSSSTQSTTLPLALSCEVGLLRFVPDYNPLAPPSTAAAYYPLLQAVAALSDRDLLLQALGLFGSVPPDGSPLTVLDLFAQQAQARYPGYLAALPLPLPTDPDEALTQLEDAFAALPSAAPTFAQAIFELYVADSNDELAQSKLARLFTASVGDAPLARLDELARFKLSASTHLTVALELPGHLLVPVKETAGSGSNPPTYTPEPATPARLLFDPGDFLFSTQGGFGFTGAGVQLSLPVGYPRLQLGSTGFQLAFDKAKIDLSGRSQLAEAQRDGRTDFRGFYVEAATAYLPPEWHMQQGAGVPAISVANLLVGTGGVSGHFSVAATGGNGTLFTAHLFGDIDVAFQRFDLVLSQNSVVSSDVAGTFSLPNFKDDQGRVVAFPFELAIGAAGYELALRAPVDAQGQVQPVVVKLAGLVELHFTRLAFGKDGHGVYLDLMADVVVTRTIPVVGKALPRKIAISKLRVDSTDGLTVAAKPVWADGTTTTDPLEMGTNLVQKMDLTIAKVLRVNNVRLKLLDDGSNPLTATATFDATLGLTDDSTAAEPAADGTPPPGFRASVSNAGFTATLRRVPKDAQTGATTGTAPSGGGNLSLLDVGLGVKLPDAASVSINAGGLVGAGRLGIFDNGTRYEGGLALSFREKLHLAAFALLNEKLPDGSPGPSLLALVTAQFQPLQLGMGFTLKGVGGLLGLHRTANTDYLRGLVRTGQTDKLLFPADVMNNLTAVLATLNGAFPAAKGRYVIGLLAQIGWGSPELLNLDVALIVELPSPVRLLVLGVLQALLPTRQNDLLKLRADFLGVIDFAAKRVSFDASLIDSRLWKFTLSGDLAFRLYQGDNPLFVITAGGFHPSFQPPAGADLTGLRRISLSIAKSDNLRLTLDCYFAVTSNTVQFGAHLLAYMGLSKGLRAEGYFNFDALFQFSPFRVEVGVEAGVAIKYGGTELLSVHLSLHLTGPGPWHVWGEASFRIWFVKISVDVDATIGERAPSEPTLAAPDVYTPLRAALLDQANWRVEAPAPALPGGVVLRPVTAAAGQVFLDPRGAISLRQRVAPLGVRLDRFGSNPLVPTGGRRFEVPAFKVGSSTYSATATPGHVEETRDFFAPSQYYALTDGEKLSRPSFERLTNGLSITSLDVLVGAPTATRRVVEYEQVLLTALGRAAVGWAGTDRLTPDAYGRLAKGSVLGQAVAEARPSERAPAPVSWADDTYEVVHGDTLSRYDPARPESLHAGHEKFGSQFEADQYCRALVAADATLAGELLVVPTYQLELA